MARKVFFSFHYERYEIFSPELFRFVQFGVAYGDEKYYTPALPNWKKEFKDLPFIAGITEFLTSLKQTQFLEYHQKLLTYINLNV